MATEIIIGIVSSILATLLIYLFHQLRNRSVKDLMNQLVDSSSSTNNHRKILKKINKRFRLRTSIKPLISKEYINNFVLSNRKKEEVFLDICVKNSIEPTKEICIRFLGNDSPSIRAKYNQRTQLTPLDEEKTSPSIEKKEVSPLSSTNSKQVVYMSELLKERYPETCNRLLQILDKHHVEYEWIKGTKDIWCRDYMPVQTESGKFIQFRYDPSYLKGQKEWEESRSDVNEVCRLNKIDATFSDINLDGGNVLICDGRAIISDRIFSENPERDKDSLIKELAHLLECEIIIIPALKSQSEDLTGHADGMVRFVDRNTIIGNERLPNEYKYMKDGLQNAIDTFNLKYIDIPFFEDKDPKFPSSAIGIYVNYLDLDDLIVAPVFKKESDAKAVDILKKVFPKKKIETIDYNDIAKEGGLLNCTTWVIRKSISGDGR